MSESAATPSPHEDALMKLYDLAIGQKSEIGMHFHELAMRDPFKAEAEYEALCDDVRCIVIESGVTRGHDWRPYEPAASCSPDRTPSAASTDPMLSVHGLHRLFHIHKWLWQGSDNQGIKEACGRCGKTRVRPYFFVARDGGG